MSAVAYTPASVQIQQQPARRMAYVRAVGPYSFHTINPAFGRIMGFAAQHGLLGPATTCLAVYHDDPEVTAGEKQRADVGITVGPTFQPEGDVQVQTIPAGKCAVLRHRGHYDTLGDAYRWLYSIWLPQSGLEPAKAPPYEIYVNDASQLPPEEWLTDICIPLAC